MAERHIGLTSALAEGYFQAAQVCLNLHHTPPAEFALRDETDELVVTVDWAIPDERTCRAWANQSEATENGAYGCALAAIELTRGLIAVSRAETMTGADFYVVPLGKQMAEWEAWIRLEISGTQLGEAEVKARLRRKVKQALRGRSSLPAFAMVVGFKARLIVAQECR